MFRLQEGLPFVPVKLFNGLYVHSFPSGKGTGEDSSSSLLSLPRSCSSSLLVESDESL